MSTTHFDGMVKQGNPVGEIIAVERFLVKIKGLQPCTINTLIMFEDGSKGYVHQIMPDYVLALHLGSEPLRTGMIAVTQHSDLVSKVGKDFIGRVISVTGEPLDGKGPIAADAVWPVFNNAPSIHERQLIDKQLESGVVAIDSLFPIVRGQRMAMLGDSKTGKSTLATQLAINQKNTDQVVIYCLIAKRHADINMLLARLEANKSLDKVIVVVATIFESLIINYLCPYVACAMAEYLWQECGQDTIIVYDDLTSHAHAYREIALLSNVSPGRDSYPGDMFFAHSSLLERAGRLAKNKASLTAVAIVHAANGDITAYLPTNILSITDGQWILDMETFRKGIRPAVNIGLSVTRAGGIGHNKRQKDFAAKSMKVLADYLEAKEFSQFGSELTPDAKKAIVIGDRIYEGLTQAPGDTYSLMAQQLMLDIVLNSSEHEEINLNLLKQVSNEYGAKVTKDEEYEPTREALKAAVLIKDATKPEPAKPTEAPKEPPKEAPKKEPEKVKS